MDITVNPRPTQSKGVRNRRLREGYVPGSMYGRTLKPMNVEVPARTISEILLSDAGLNTVLKVSVEGHARTHTVVVDNLERDPITRGYINIGLHQVAKGDKVHAQIPLVLQGTPADVALRGALLDQTLGFVDVSAQPTHLPSQIEVDVSGMAIGDVLRVSDLAALPHVDITTSEDVVVASVHVSSTAREVEAAEATAPAVEDLPADASSDSVTEA
jgi:large subunit ribosomal protein L25